MYLEQTEKQYSIPIENDRALESPNSVGGCLLQLDEENWNFSRLGELCCHEHHLKLNIYGDERSYLFHSFSLFSPQLEQK